MLSNTSKYGIRAVVYLANQPDLSVKIGIKKISDDLSLPTPFLAKILQLLTKQKILSSTKGPHGGFSLLKDPELITLLDIVTTIDGEDVFTNCILHNRPCNIVQKDRVPCALHDDYVKIGKEIMALFRKKTVYSLVKGLHKSGKEITI
jgi:Rrf2 family protein